MMDWFKSKENKVNRLAFEEAVKRRALIFDPNVAHHLVLRRDGTANPQGCQRGQNCPRRSCHLGSPPPAAIVAAQPLGRHDHGFPRGQMAI